SLQVRKLRGISGSIIIIVFAGIVIIVSIIPLVLPYPRGHRCWATRLQHAPPRGGAGPVERLLSGRRRRQTAVSTATPEHPSPSSKRVQPAAAAAAAFDVPTSRRRAGGTRRRTSRRAARAAAAAVRPAQARERQRRASWELCRRASHCRQAARCYFCCGLLNSNEVCFCWGWCYYCCCLCDRSRRFYQQGGGHQACCCCCCHSGGREHRCSSSGPEVLHHHVLRSRRPGRLAHQARRDVHQGRLRRSRLRLRR
ncbi:unnamed protein product, partial [Ectocarpus fasciculatus]